MIDIKYLRERRFIKDELDFDTSSNRCQKYVMVRVYRRIAIVFTDLLRPKRYNRKLRLINGGKMFLVLK